MKNRTEEHKSQGAAHRLPWLDAARLLAITFVVFNHALNTIYTSYIPQGGTAAECMTAAETVFRALAYTLSRYGVPLFLMITGALLLPRDYETPGVTRRLYRHNILRLLVATELWLAIYFIGILVTGQGQRALLLGTDPASARAAAPGVILHALLNQLFIDPVTLGNMWYMQMIIPVYMLLPAIATAVKRLPGKCLAIPAIAVYAYFCVLPTLQVILAACGSGFRLTPALHASYLFTYYVIFIVLGYLTARGALARFSTRTLLTALALLTAASAAYLVWLYHTPVDYQFSYEFPLLYPAAPCVFELIRRHADRSRRIITLGAATAFAVYMIHRPLLLLLQRALRFHPGTSGITGFAALCLLSFSIAVLATLALSRVRPVRRWLLLMK